MLRLLMAALIALPLGAFQYPGQIPPGQVPTGQYPPGGGYPPGSYPQGRYPNGGIPGGGIGLPSKSGGRSKKNQKKTDQLPTIEADGVTLLNDGSKLQVGTQDGRILTMTLNPETKWTKAGADIQAGTIVPRTTVHVVAAEDDEAFLTAVSVELKKDAPSQAELEADRPSISERPRPSGSAGTKPAEDEEMARPTILQSPDAPGRPVMRRGKPATTATSDSEPDPTPTASKPAAAAKTTASATKAKSTDGSLDFTIESDTPATKRTNKYDQLLDKTYEWAQTFTQGLPNFLCQQSTTRYMQQSRSAGFEPIDVVTAKVLYEDGREKYSQITVGGRATKKTMMEIGGSTSTGEFASVLGGLFEDRTHTEFKFLQSTTIGRDAAAVYDFKVALPHSNWSIQVGGQLLRPAYSGSIWVDKNTSEIRRIEMQADNIPKDFPQDTVASAVDYESVSLGTAKFLLPVHAENLSCQRGSPICTKNTIDFRDYHRYSGESTIEFK
jgi:hypothetical protein